MTSALSSGGISRGLSKASKARPKTGDHVVGVYVILGLGVRGFRVWGLGWVWIERVKFKECVLRLQASMGLDEEEEESK